MSLLRQILTYRSCQEQYHDHSRGYPERAIEVRVPVQHVEEPCAREDGGLASSQDFVGVDVEELRVEGERPEVPLRGAGAAAVVGAGEEGVLSGGLCWRGVGFR